jgi:CheY-like chemotaxis protein
MNAANAAVPFAAPHGRRNEVDAPALLSWGRHEHARSFRRLHSGILSRNRPRGGERGVPALRRRRLSARACGLHLIEAANGLEAVRVLQTGLHIDVVFSHVQMPGPVDGVALASWIQREHPATKVILTSGRAERAWSPGGRHLVLPKPYDHRDLEQRIRIALAAKQEG